MQPDTQTPPAAVMSVREYAGVTGQKATAVRAQLAAGTCPVDSVVLRRADPARPGSRPRYGILRVSVDRLLGEATS